MMGHLGLFARGVEENWGKEETNLWNLEEECVLAMQTFTLSEEKAAYCSALSS